MIDTDPPKPGDEAAPGTPGTGENQRRSGSRKVGVPTCSDCARTSRVTAQIGCDGMALATTSPTMILAEGRQAGYRGDEEGANPYPSVSEEYPLWLEGWRTPDGAEAEAHPKDATLRFV